MPNINAALGVAQLEHLDSRLGAKRLLAKRYSEVFADFDGLELVRSQKIAAATTGL